MPITDPSLPIRFLEALETIEVRFVVLHKEDEIGTTSLDSDLDLAIDWPADDVIQQMTGALRAAELHPVIRWPYDIGGASTFILGTTTGDHGIQVDLLHDPRGHGRYGLRTSELLNRAVAGRRYPVPDPLDEQLYLLHKRWCKNQTSVFQKDLEDLRATVESDDARERVQRLFAVRAAATIQQLLDGNSPKRRVAWPRLEEMARILGRLVEPIGYWAEIVGPAPEGQLLVQTLHSRFDSWLVSLVSSERPSGLVRYPWWLRRVAPVRVRHGVFLSHSIVRSRPRADLTIEWYPSLTATEAARRIIVAMAARVAS